MAISMTNRLSGLFNDSSISNIEEVINSDGDMATGRDATTNVLIHMGKCVIIEANLPTYGTKGCRPRGMVGQYYQKRNMQI